MLSPSGPGQWLAELVATAGLFLVILRAPSSRECGRVRRRTVERWCLGCWTASGAASQRFAFFIKIGVGPLDFGEIVGI